QCIGRPRLAWAAEATPSAVSCSTAARPHALTIIFQANNRQRRVIARTAVEPHALAVLAGHDPEAAVLDLVQPRRPGRGSLGFWGEARRDKSRRQGTLFQHEGVNTSHAQARQWKRTT